MVDNRKLWQTFTIVIQFHFPGTECVKRKKERDRKYKYQRAERLRKSSTAENAF